MNDIFIAIVLAAFFSILICIIEVRFRSNAAFSPCINNATVLFLFILLVGNIATTLFAAATTGDLIVSKVSKVSEGAKQFTNPLIFPWFWYAFIGVFGFEALLQNINLTFFEKGVLSINDWINRARDNAVATTIEKQTNSGYQKAQKLSERLKTLPIDELNAQVTQALGADRLRELDLIVSQTYSDPNLTKALALAHEAPEKASAITT